MKRVVACGVRRGVAVSIAAALAASVAGAQPATDATPPAGTPPAISATPPTSTPPATGLPPAADDRVVDVVIAATPVDASLLASALAEPLERQGVRLRWMRVEWFDLANVVVPDPSAPPAVARAWFDLVGVSRRAGGPSGPGAVVYLVDGPWDRVLVRTVSLDAGFDEVAREELAQILGSGVEGILAGVAPGRPREEVRAELGVVAPAPPPPPPIVPPSPLPVVPPPPPPVPVEPPFADRATIDFSVAYVLGGFATGVAPASGVELGVGLAQRTGDFRLGLSLAGGWLGPPDVERDGIGMRLDLGMLRLMGSVEFPFASWFALEAELGGGVDIARAEPHKQANVIANLQPVGYDAAGILRAVVAMRLGLGAGFALWLGVGMDVEPSPHRYVIDRSAARETVLEPWPVRPFGLARLSFDLLGLAR